MNPQQQPPASRGNSRFVRGRARGGGAYRPYFYFRRNGRTVPAGGNTGGARTAQGVFKAPRGRAKSTRRGTTNENSGIVPPPGLNSSFLCPQYYAAPENGIRVSSISTDGPVQYPGWRLYYHRDDYKAGSNLDKRLKIIEEHYNNNLTYYDYLEIQNCGYFKLQAKVVMFDTNLLQAWPNLLEEMQMAPEKTLAAFGVAMHAAVSMAVIDASISLPTSNRSHYYSPQTRVRKILSRPVGFTKLNLVSAITKENVDSMYCVRGCVTAIGNLEAPFDWIAYKCSRCGQEQALKQQGFHPVRPFGCKRAECHAKDSFVQQRSSPFSQILPVQMIRLSEANLQAAKIDADTADYLDIELHHDYVDSLYPGQEIIVTGIVKIRSLTEDQEYPNYSSSSVSSSIQTYLQALYIEDAKHISQHFTERDIEAVSLINAEEDSFKLMVQSLAPEVYGQELVKAGVLLSLFGGAGSQLHDDSDINILLVGDPGVGKSSLLHIVSKLSGRGSVINGKRPASALKQLTLSITGNTKLSIETGALLSSHTGHCSVDDVDRLASQQEMVLHFMQTQKLAMPFANIFASFHTPCSILAAANSVRGHYDNSKLLTENIRLHPSLLRQFQLLFVMLDKPNKDMDTSLTEHIRAVHAGIKKSSAIAVRYELKPKANNSMNGSVSGELNENDTNYDLEERLKLNHIGAEGEEELDLLPPILLKKFIAYARLQVKPLLTNEAADALKDFYMELRQQNDEKFSSCSTSQLEGLIRLVQARARIDFSNEATKLHVRDVICIVRQSMADTTMGDYIDRNPVTNLGVGGSQNSLVKKFLNLLHIRSNVLGRKTFDFDELKDMARIAGISSGVTNIVDIVNLQGFLLKKGPNIYEVMET